MCSSLYVCVRVCVERENIGVLHMLCFKVELKREKKGKVKREGMTVCCWLIVKTQGKAEEKRESND